jgi:hypothetical protein
VEDNHRAMITTNATGLRNTGVDVIGDMPWGTHFCLFYDTKVDLLETAVPYCRAGLQSEEFCLWVVAPPVTKEDALPALQQAVPDFARYLLGNSIEIVAARDWYLQDGTFDLKRVIAGWNEKLARASAEGYAGVRVTGDTAWLERKHWNDFCEYEDALNGSIANQRLSVLCTYPLAACGAVEILDVVRTHQFAVTRRRGSWHVIETAGHKQAKAEIKRLNEELEQRVIERTGQLAAVNEELTTEVQERQRAEEALRQAFDENKKLKDQLYRENLVLRDEIDRASMFEEVVGTSKALKAVLSRIAKVAPTDSTVLITGETGTGKELFARAIHKRSDRPERAFVSVNCAALAPSLISSELFGHEKGAFTGATQRRAGRFEMADGGTIFLDEVGELSARRTGRALEGLTGTRVRAGRGHAVRPRGCPRHCCHQPGFENSDCPWSFSARSVLSAECVSHRGAASARATRRHRDASRIFRAAVCKPSRQEYPINRQEICRPVAVLWLAGQHPRATECH